MIRETVTTSWSVENATDVRLSFFHFCSFIHSTSENCLVFVLSFGYSCICFASTSVIS